MLEPVALFGGVYHPVRIGMWLDEKSGKPQWAVDITTGLDDGPDAIVGNGETLQEALDAATANLTVYVEGTSDGA